MSRAPRRPRRPRTRTGDVGADQPHLVPGERAVRELLVAAPERVHRLLLDRRRDFGDLEAAALQAGVAVQRVDTDVLRSSAGGTDARGVLAIASTPPVWPLDALIEHTLRVPPRPRTVMIALDGVVDPQNLGAIMRTAEFFGATGLLWTRDRAVGLTPAVVRASAGASERLPLCVVTNLATALRSCKDAGLWVLGTVVEGGAALGPMCVGETLPEALVLVMGSEERGLRRLTRQSCDFLATLARRGALGSLNVAAATAACLSLLTGVGGSEHEPGDDLDSDPSD